MGVGYLWVKAFHIVFVAAWFAGLFYLPRLFVNLAMVPADSHAERERLLPGGREEGVVDDGERTGGTRAIRERCDIRDAQQRVARRLDPHQVGLQR